jgi:sugar phosphate isomerase/epimerase
MAQIGVMTTEFSNDTFEGTVDEIALHGIGCVQLQLGSVIRGVGKADSLLRGLDVLGEHLSIELATYARSVLSSRGLVVSAVDGTYNMVHPDPDRRARNLDHLITLIELAPAFGTDIVTLCTGSRDEIMWHRSDANQSPDAWRDLIEQIRSAAHAAERVGVTLAFEPEHNNVVDSAQRARRLMDEVGSPAVKVLMDGANLFHRGDLFRMQDHLAEAFALVGGDVVLAHAKDLDHDGDAGGRAAGQGVMDYSLYLSGLQRSGFDGAIVLHQLTELAPDHLDAAFQFVRDHAPAGYLNWPTI